MESLPSLLCVQGLRIEWSVWEGRRGVVSKSALKAGNCLSSECQLHG